MANVLILPENTKGRDFVVGDIHGAFDLLKNALAEARFDPAKDRLISVGDLIDRGPQSAQCIEFLRQPWFFAIRGNHEDMFLDIVGKDGTFDSDKAEWNRRNGMGWIFSETPETLAALRVSFEQLPLAIEVPTTRGTVGFVHAEVPAGMDWKTFKEKLKSNDERTVQTALWGRKRIEAADTDGVAGIDRLFLGHTPQGDGPRKLGNCYYVDTGGVFRLLHSDQAAQFFLTMSDITAKTMVLKGASAKKKSGHKVITDVSKKKKPFGKYGPQR